MVGILTLQSLQMETIQDYFEYILESKINGQHKQAEIFFEDLSDEQKIEFIKHERYFNSIGDKLPPSKVYGELLDQAIDKFLISNQEARKSYGQFTISQWKQMLNN